MQAGVKTWTNGVAGEVRSWWDNNIAPFFSQKLSKVGEWVGNVKDRVSNGFETMRYTVADKVRTISENVENYFYKIRTSIHSDIESARQTVADRVSSIKDNITNSFNNAKNNAVETFTNLKSKVSETFDGIKTNITDKMKNVGDTLSTSVTSIKDNVSRGFDNVKQSVSERMLSISNYVSDTFSSVKNKLSDIGNAISNAWNNAKSYASNTLSVNWWGGGYAEGGSITSGKAYLVGEEGPEIFVPRSSGYIMNNDETSDLIGGSGKSIQIIIQGDVYDDESSLRRKFHSAVMDILETELAYG